MTTTNSKASIGNTLGGSHSPYRTSCPLELQALSRGFLLWVRGQLLAGWRLLHWKMDGCRCLLQLQSQRALLLQAPSGMLITFVRVVGLAGVWLRARPRTP